MQLTEVEKIASSCICRWGEDVKTKNFSNKLDEFISQVNNNEDLKNILLKLVKHYNYYSRKFIEELMIQYYEYITDLHLDEDYTIYSKIQNNPKIDSSSYFLEEFKTVNNISNSFTYDIERLNIKNFDQIENVIFLDDIIGTGKTVIKFFKRNIKKLNNVNIYIFCVEILQDGKEALEEFFEEYSLKCQIKYHNLHMKAFKENYIFSLNHKENEILLKKFEETLWKPGSPNILGYENSQAIVSFFRNTPNNTISSFWYNNDDWKGLFPRDKRIPAFKKKRNMNYNIKKLEQLNG